MAVLYRKYRPQSFSEVLNQKPIIQTLKNQVLAGTVAHAYLFTGSRGVGKTSVARILAKAINCLSANQLISGSVNQQTQEIPCGVCSNCAAIAAGNFLDLVEVDAASNTGVDNIRDLIEHVKFSPSAGKYKVFIIDEVHMLSKGAFNALLKTLEEPPKHAIFILATTEINKVPATIVSRTQRFDFKALSSADLFSHLQHISKQENLKFSDDVLELIAQNAEGSVRDALSLFDKLTTLGNNATLEECQQLLGITDLKICENLLEIISLGQAQKLPDFFSALAEKGLDYFILNRDFLEYLRKVLIYKASEGKVISNLQDENLKRMEELAGKFLLSDIIFIIRLFLKSYKDLASSPSGEIPLLLAGIEASLKKSSHAPAAQIITEQKIPEKKTVISQPIVEVQEPVLAAYDEMSLENAQELWPKLTAKIKEINGPLASMLKNCSLAAVEKGRIIVGVKFAFDKQNIENVKNSSVIASIIEELTGKRLGISARVIKSETTEVVGTAQALSEALKVFGGELIE